MASRAREILDRSRVLLDRSRVAAAQFLIAPPKHPGYAPAAGPAIAELPPAEPVTAPEIPQPPADDAVLAEICASVALRDLNLLDQLLARLEELEAGEEDHHRLAELYQLDHLATRLRRNAENLRVLAGQDTADGAARATSVLDLMREAMSSIDHYARITIGRVINLGVVGFAAEDLGRVLAELFDNAANQSSPELAGERQRPPDRAGQRARPDRGRGHRHPRRPRRRPQRAPGRRRRPRRRRGAAHGPRRGLPARRPPRCHRAARPAQPARHGGHRAAAHRDRHRTRRARVVGHPHRHRRAGQARGRRRAGRPSAACRAAARAPSRGKSPRRAPRKPSPRPRPLEQVSGGTTANGLPRRVPGSIRGAAPEPPPPPPAAPAGSGHEQLLADLGAFADGEQAALAENRTQQDETPGGTAS